MVLGVFVVAGLRVLEREQFRALIRRAGWWFAAGAVVAWLLLIVSGFFMAQTHMSSLADLGKTDFGRPLLDKIGWVAITLVAAVGHVLAGRSASRPLVMVSRVLALVTFVGTLVVFYYATLLG